MASPVSLWDALNATVDSLGGLTIDEAVHAVERHAVQLEDVEM